MHLTAKFHHSKFNRLEGIVRRNKQTNTVIKAKFHYATQLASWFEAARELDSVIEFGLKQTDAAENIHLASLRYAGG